MHRSLLSIAILFISSLCWADENPLAKSCIWDGEPSIQKAVIDSGKNWMTAVEEMHAQGTAAPSDFEGVGSCRFIPRGGQVGGQAIIEDYLKNGYTIIPTKAYLKLLPSETKFVLPKAGFAFVTNYLFVKKDFYASGNVEVCRQQMEDMVVFGRSEQSIDMGFGSVAEYRKTTDGVSVVINAQTLEANKFGICHFHSIQ